MRRKLEIAGWILVWTLFTLFNVLLLTNHVRELLWLTLASLLPVWLLTAVGGSVELAALLRARGKGGRNEGNDGGDAGRAGAARHGAGDGGNQRG